ncbi:UNVERIFIED_CONTAM: hypothetical protein HDU68_005652 [Siphonaria sp. JEL0065]|nr:hypothetical protein HDU68_005652 [Siphonaria sp. JEL0065]
MFDIGGGRGRSGSSFFEYLAQRNYDTFAVDLRGTRESMQMGAMSPAFIKEHIEVDVPSAIACIKRMGHEKVYLVGHSMGGAISCAVAGYIPNDIAGVVHLAGLYQLTAIPILGDLLDLYRSTCPPLMQNAISATAGFALRSFVHVFNPAISAISGVLSPEASPNTPAIGGTHPATQPSLPPLGPSLSVRYIATYVRRQRLPVRPVVDGLLYVRQFLPNMVSKCILNMLYPSPWLPYSVEDPASFVDRALESPTIGICVSVGKSALHREIFNQWLEDSSFHRAEKPQSLPPSNSSTLKLSENGDSHGDLKKLRSQNNSPKPANALSPPQPLSIKIPTLKIEDDYDGTTSEADDDEDDETPLMLKDNGLLQPPVQESSQQKAKQEIVQEAKLSYSLHHGWNELGPYLDQFERLQHLPLFFCPANADAILRTEDSVAGYHRSGSKWKEIIEYRDFAAVPSRLTSNRSTATTSINDGVSPTVPRQTLSSTSSLTIKEIEASLPLTPTLTLDTTDRLKRVSSGSSFLKPSLLYSPTTSSSAALSAAAASTTTLEIEDDYDPIKPRYSVPASYKYGHCDILGGKHAELVWKKVVDWLDVTSAREKEWRFRRRYSAK